MRWVVLFFVLACSDEAPAAPATSPAAPAAPETPSPETPTTPAPDEGDTDEPSLVSATGLAVHRRLRASAPVLAAAREDRPTTITPIFQAGAGDEGGVRVHWIGFQTSPFDELRGRAADEGRVAAFDAEVDEKEAACIAAEAGCEHCDSDCFQRARAEFARVEREIVLVRVTAPAEGTPRVDASQVIWRGGEFETAVLVVRDVDDLDGDERLELSLAIQVTGDWPAGDGGHAEVRHVVVDADTLKVQFDIRRSREEDGHGGNVMEESRVSFRDRNDDGRGDYAIRYTRRVGLHGCFIYGEGDEIPDECRDLDERRRAHYSIDDDEWLLAEGETWPWL